MDNGARRNVTHKGMEGDARTGKRRRKRSQKESKSHKPNRKVSHPFSLTFLVWSPTPYHSWMLLGVRLESWETMRGGKHHRVDGTWVSWPFVISSLLVHHEHYNVDLRGLFIRGREGSTWSWPHRMEGCLPRIPRHLAVKERDH